MTLEVGVQRPIAAPLSPSPTQSSQKNVIDLRVVDRGNLLQQGLRFILGKQ